MEQHLYLDLDQFQHLEVVVEVLHELMQHYQQVDQVVVHQVILQQIQLEE
jgi:hypothetical protein